MPGTKWVALDFCPLTARVSSTLQLLAPHFRLSKLTPSAHVAPHHNQTPTTTASVAKIISPRRPFPTSGLIASTSTGDALGVPLFAAFSTPARYHTLPARSTGACQIAIHPFPFPCPPPARARA